MSIAENELTLIHTPDETNILIGDKELPYVTNYKVTASDRHSVELNVTFALPVGQIKIASGYKTESDI